MKTMDSDELISVIVPVYNVERYLNKCLESLERQTYRNLEIILVDDGSTDGSGDICRQFCNKDVRFKYIYKENGGQGQARNVGLANAHGSYYGFVDSDDYVDVKMFETLLYYMKTCQADIVSCGKYLERDCQLSVDGEIVDEPKTITGVEAVKELIRDKIVRSYAWDKLYKKEIFYNEKFPEGRIYEDLSLLYRLVYKAKTVCIIPDTLYYYQVRNGSTSFTNDYEKWYRNCHVIIQGHKERYDFFKRKSELEITKISLLPMLLFVFSSIDTGYRVADACNNEYDKCLLKELRKEAKTNKSVGLKYRALIDIYLLPPLLFKWYRLITRKKSGEKMI